MEIKYLQSKVISKINVITEEDILVYLDTLLDDISDGQQEDSQIPGEQIYCL